MIFIFYIFLLFCFLKGFYYGLFEIKNQKNKKAGIIVIFLALVGIIMPSISLYLSY